MLILPSLNLNYIPSGALTLSEEIIMNFGNNINATRTTVDGLKTIQDVDLINNGVCIADMQNVDDVASGIGITTTSSWDGTSGTGVNTDGDNIPAIVWLNYWFTSASDTFKFTGLNANETNIEVVLFGSRATTGSRPTIYSVGGSATKTHESVNNNELTEVDNSTLNGANYFRGLTADSSGELTVTTTAGSFGFGYLNGGILRRYV